MLFEGIAWAQAAGAQQGSEASTLLQADSGRDLRL